MEKAGSAIGLGRRLAKRLYPVTLAIGVLISVGLPATYYILESTALRRTATLYAQDLAGNFQALVIDVPNLWKYPDNVRRYYQILYESRPHDDVTMIRVLDEAGQSITEYEHVTAAVEGWWNRYPPVGSAPIIFNNRKLGTVEVREAHGTLLLATLTLLLLSTAVGTGLAVLVYRYPVGIVQGLEGQVQDLVESVQRSHAELERLYATAQEQSREVAVLREVGTTVTSSLDLPAVLEAIAESAVRLIGAQRCAVFELDRGDQRLHARATRGMRPDQPLVPMKLGQGAAGSAALRREPVFSPDVYQQPLPMYDELWEEAGVTLREVVRKRGYQAILAVPLISKETVLGAICIYWDEVHEYNEREVRLLTALARQAAIAIENARLYRQAEERAGKLTALSALTRLITSAPDNREVFHAVAMAATSLLGARSARVWVADPAERVVRVQESFGINPKVEELQTDFPSIAYGSGVVGRVFESRVPEYILDIQEDARWLNKRLAKEGDLHAFAGLPLVAGERVAGVLSILFGERREFTAEEKELMGLLADQAAVTIERTRLFDELKRSYKELQRTQGQLIQSEKLRALGGMAGGVAHDFNNLLAAILGRAQLLLLRLGEGEVAPDVVRRSLGVIERAALDGAETVRRLLEFTRVIPQLKVAEAVDVNDLLASVLAASQPRWKDEAEARGAHIEVVEEFGRVPPVVGNAAELREVLLSLVFNAIDAMPQGGTLTLASWAEDGAIYLAVKDTGVGIPAEVRSRIFEPFFTTKGPQASGLGLSVSYGIICRHDGEITVDSRPGQGTTFTIKLPVWPAPAPRAEAAPQPARVGLRVLVIDDEAEVRETLRDLLAAAGQEVWEAGSGPEGLEFLERQPVELVCTDLGMPGMTGWEVAERVKARWPGQKVALITGWGAQVEPEELEAHGVDFLINKPFQLKEILGVLKLVLEEAVRWPRHGGP